MPTPSQQDFIDIAAWVYNSGKVPGVPAPGYRPFVFSGNHYQSHHAYDAYDPSSGFYAAAYVTGTGSERSLVIGFEGTNVFAPAKFAAAEIAADLKLYFGGLPNALVEAASFTSRVVHVAEARGIAPDHIFVDGHSLGAAEAEYAAAKTGIGGISYGTPGVSTAFIPAGTAGGPTNYVDYGDPVGNYAFTAPAPVLGNFLFSDTILHFGDTHYVGNSLHALPLELAGSLFGQGDAQDATALAILLGSEEAYHPLTHYAADLGLDDVGFPHGAQSLDPSGLTSLLHGLLGIGGETLI